MGGGQTLIVTTDCRDKMMKLRLDGKGETYLKDQDGLRNSGIDLNEKAVMPKVLSYVALDIRMIGIETGFKYVFSNDLSDYRLFEMEFVNTKDGTDIEVFVWNRTFALDDCAELDRTLYDCKC